MNTTQFDVCVRGNGIVGMTMALCLAQQNFRVALQGLFKEKSVDVRAYALSKRSRDLVQSVGAWPADDFAQIVTEMKVNGDGQGKVHFNLPDASAQALNWIVDVPELERNLHAAVKLSHHITCITQDLANAPALTLICEGRGSQTAALQGLNWQARAYDQWALATRVRTSYAWKRSHCAYQWFGERTILGLLPLKPSEDLTHQDWAIVWSLPPHLAKNYAQLDESEFCRELAEQSRHLVGDFSLTSPRFYWPLKHGMAAHWFSQSEKETCVLVGDSAHNVHPLAGQGLNLGLGDVAYLAKLIKERASWRSITDHNLLRQYERQRKAAFTLIGDAGDTLQRLFSSSIWIAKPLRNFGLCSFNHITPLKKWAVKRAT